MNDFYKKINKTPGHLFILLIILVIYGQTLAFELNIDDYLVLDSTARKIHSVKDLFNLFTQPFNRVDYRPVSLFSFGLENLLFGEIHPRISHGINVLLFYLIGWTGYRLLNTLTKQQVQPVVLISMLLFTASSINTEVVCSLKSRDNLLSLLFTLIALRLLTLEYTIKNIFRIALGVTAFFIALLAKRDSLGILLFVPVFLLFHTDRPIRKKLVLTFSVFVVLLIITQIHKSVTHEIVLAPAVNSTDIGKVTFTENPLVENFSGMTRFYALFQTNAVYLVKLLLPVDLRYYYGYDHYSFYNSWRDIPLILIILIQCILVSAIIFFSKRNKYLWLGLAGYFIFIFYALNFYIPMAGIVADRYAFQSGIWFWLLFVLLLKEISNQTRYAEAWRLICLLLILIYTGVSAYRASAWKNKLTLLERDTPHLTRSYEAQRIAASIYMEHAQEATDPDLKRTYLQKALIHAQSANDIYPMNMVTHKMEGIIFFNLRDFPASKNAFLQAYQQDTTAPETLEMLGDLSYVEQNFTQASMYYSKASTQDPGSNGLVSKISTILYESGDRDSCLQYNLRLIGTSPELWAPYENLGYYYLEQGDSSQAKMYFNQAKQKGLSDETPL